MPGTFTDGANGPLTTAGSAKPEKPQKPPETKPTLILPKIYPEIGRLG